MAFEIIEQAHWSTPITTSTFRLGASLYQSTIKPFKDDDYTYKLFVRIKTIMTGMFKSKTDCFEFKEIENSLLSYLWTMQELFVIKANGKYACWEVVRTYWEAGERIVEARILRDGDEGVNKRTYLFRDGVHGVYVMWDTERLSSYYLWWPILHALSKMLRTARTSSKMDAKRFVRVVNHTNKAVLEAEREAYENESNPFLDIYKKINTEDNEGKIVEQKPQTSTQYHSITADSKTKQIWENIWNHRNFWFSIAGIPTQDKDRNSGKTSTESVVEIVDNLYQTEVTLRNLNVLAQKLWNLYADKIEFVNTIDLASVYVPEEKEDENEEPENELRDS